MVKSYSTSEKEKDTYDLTDREKKEEISREDVLEHWEARAKRDGVQAVMSARHPLEENEEATRKLREEISNFLEGQIDGKKVFELGFGIGRMTEMLAEKADNVVACDISKTMFEKARKNLKNFDNVDLHLGKITELGIDKKSFDLCFVSIVLLHILNPEELRKTIEALRKISDRVFIVEHTYEGPDFPISKYSILRTEEEYEKSFKPFRLIKKKVHLCAGDKFSLMLFER